MRRIFLLALAVLSTGVLFAQTTVTGKVSSAEDSSAVSFASIVVKGTQQIATSDDNGEYALDNVASDAVLIFSSIGFTTVEIPVNGKAVVNAVLQPDTEVLDDVMVVVYGTVKKGSYSGSAAVVKDDALKDAPVMNFESVLYGKAAGVQVAASSGQPGMMADISIRGFGSFNAGNQPLYVIDGVPAKSDDGSSGNISTSAMAFLNPSDIKSITILKDAAASSLYGSRASNGVILITTKKGQASGKQSIADQYLNDVRKRADITATDVTATLDLVATERQKEFIAEGHRFFDVMRTGRTIVRDMSVDARDYDERSITWNDHTIVLPIAETERAIYSLLDQNPKY